MTISAREFKLIAKKLAAIRPFDPKSASNYTLDPLQKNYNHGKWQGWAEAVNTVADACVESNGKFNKEKFIEACND